jgi:hypothetical protein
MLIVLRKGRVRLSPGTAPEGKETPMVRRSLTIVVFAGLICSPARAQHGGGSAVLSPLGGGFGGYGVVGSYNPLMGYGYGTGFSNPTTGYGNGFGYGYGYGGGMGGGFNNPMNMGNGFGANFNNPMNMGNGFGANFNNPMNAGKNNPQGAMNALIPTNIVPPGFNNENPRGQKASTAMKGAKNVKGQSAKAAKARTAKRSSTKSK